VTRHSKPKLAPVETTSWMNNINPRLYAVIKDAFNFIWNRDELGIFKSPVDTQEVNGYLDIIKEPMDLSTIKQKMVGYSRLDDLNRDVEIMLRNCMVFNNHGFYYDVQNYH
jgi:hypothetical protein